MTDKFVAGTTWLLVTFHPEGQVRLGRLMRMVLSEAILYMQINFYNLRNDDLHLSEGESHIVIPQLKLETAKRVAKVCAFPSPHMLVRALHLSSSGQSSRMDAHFSLLSSA